MTSTCPSATLFQYQNHQLHAKIWPSTPVFHKVSIELFPVNKMLKLG